MTQLPSRIRRLLFSLVIGVTAVSAMPIAGNWLQSAAQAQYVVAAEFRDALSPYGRWVTHSQWGEVWLPDPIPADWRPYTRGRWVLTDEWGWYWQEDDEEAAWGWVANHYGRWVHDPELGWLWVPGEEWAPAWVDWRYGGDYVGWAPLPPAGAIFAYQDDPLYWSFVRPRYLLAPRVFAYLAPAYERVTIIKRTVIVDRNRHRPRNKDHHADRDRDRDRDRDHPRQRDEDRGNRHVANRGIDPGLIARATGKPIRASKIEPAVLRGTKVPGTREVDAKDGRNARSTIRNTHVVIKPADRVTQPRHNAVPQGHVVQREQPRAFVTHDAGNAAIRTVPSPPIVRHSYDAPRFNPPPPVMRRTSPPTAPVVMRRMSPPSSFAMEPRRYDGASGQSNRRQTNDERRQFR